MVVAGSGDMGGEDWHTIGGPSLRRLTIELVVEDRTHRAVGQRADLDGARCRRFETLGAERTHQAHDAETGAEALFGVRPALPARATPLTALTRLRRLHLPRRAPSQY